MKVTQGNERTFTVVLSDAELGDLTQEAETHKHTPLELMKAVFLSVFLQFISCYWRRAIREHGNIKEKPESEKDTVDFMPDGG